MDTLKEPKRVKARKEHKCDLCGKTIAVSEEHEVATYKQDYIYNWRVCDRCKSYVEEALQNKVYDWSDSMGWQDFHDYMFQENREVALGWWEQN